MKNKYSKIVIIALISIIVFLYVITVKGYAANLPATFQETVTGVVTDEAGMPIMGVSVTIKGTNRGTTSNIDGAYSITVNPQAVLVFSYLGFKTIEIPIDGQREINLRLVEDITALKEVEINAGYYHTTRRESTGNISRVTAEEIELQPVVSPLQALQGRMAGVEVIPGGSNPGTASTIRIRGINSLREEGNYPLYIIDGVPINSTPLESNSNLTFGGIDPLNTLNLSNIESIEVLKDADATAIYGSRGANGVILITTKKGRAGKTELQARVYTGASTVPNRIDLLNTEEYLQIRRQAFENDKIEPTVYNAYDLVLWDQNRYTDWQDFFFGGTSSMTNANLSTAGGNENTSFRLGGSYHKQGTIYPVDFDYQKVTGNFNLAHTSENRKLEINLSVNYGVDNNNLAGNLSLEGQAFNMPPNAPSIFQVDGSLNWKDWKAAGLENPLEGYYNNSNTQINNLISGLGVSFQLLPNLYIKSNLGYTSFNSQELVKRPKRSYNPSSWGNINHASSHLQTYRRSWIVEPQLVFAKVFGKFKLDALLGGTFQESEFNSLGLQGEGYVAESIIGNLGAAEGLVNATNQNSLYRYNAVFSRIGINWDRKYFINLTGRRDGSSRFGPGKQLANFGAIGSTWIFSEEPFFKKHISFLNFGKLRGSYGTTGNDQIGDYGYLDAYEATPGPGGLYPTQLSNPDYSWEVNKKLEGAIELGFLKDRINLGLSWYRNRSSSQLIGYPLPAITGFTTIQANLPATVENKGWELEINSTNIQSKDFYWQTSFNVTIPESRLVSYPDIDQSSYANTYRVGHPLNISLLYQYEGLDPNTGFYNITDINQDGRFDYKDRVKIQHFGREFFGGINNNLRLKSFSLQFLWQFVKQKGTLDLFNAGELGNQRAEVLQALQEGSRFQKPSTSYQASTAYSRVVYSSLPVVDASFLRLKTLSLGYNLPSSVLKHMKIREGKIFLHGQNLLTFTDYKGIDPEMPNRGISFASLRTVTTGLQLQF